MARVAMVGLGAMGQGMAGRLWGAGHELVVHNRTPEKAADLVAAGARWAGSPAEAARGAEAVLVMVADADASRAVWTGPDGVLAAEPAAGALAVECSTLSRDWVLELAELARARGMRYVPRHRAAGRGRRRAAHLLVGAEAADLRAAAPLLGCLGEVLRFGSVGAGTAYKLVII